MWMLIRITNSRARWTASRPVQGRVFSLLPPENAVGNYVKVVQRVPVKIIFDEAHRLVAIRPGSGPVGRTQGEGPMSEVSGVPVSIPGGSPRR